MNARDFNVLNIILLLFIAASVTSKQLQKAPKIWLAAYSPPGKGFGVKAPKKFRTSPVFKNAFVTKNRTEYISTSGVTALGFKCEASYPVEWAIPEMSQLEHNSGFDISSGSERLSNFLSSQQEPETKHFQTYLRVYRFTNPKLYHEPIGKFLSAGFSCRPSASNSTATPSNNSTSSEPLKSSSIYIYMAAEKIENQGKTLSLPYTTAESNRNVTSSAFVFPCRPAQPDLKILIEKKNEAGWEQLPSLNYSFNPKIGFTFPPGSSLSGTYRCRAKKAKPVRANVLTINLTESNLTKVSLKEEPFHSRLKGNARVHFGNRVRCCTGNEGVKPNIFFKKCNNRLQCDIAREVSLPKKKMLTGGIKKDFVVEDENDCSSVKRLKQPFVVECKGDNIDFLGVIGMSFWPNAGNVTWRDSKSKKSKIFLTKNIANNHELDLKDKMLIVVGHLASFGDGKDSKGSGDFLPGATHFHMTLLEVWDRDETIVEYPRNFYLEGEPLRIVCFGLKNIHSFGAQLRINWKNGTKSLLEKDEVPVMRKVYFHGIVADMSRDEYNFFVVFFAKEVKASLEMESVDCFMPAERKASWDKLHYPLNIR